MIILLVEPADSDAAILASALRVEGFEVVVAKTTSLAREILQAQVQPIALAIVDLMLKSEAGRGEPPASAGKNGLELARELRANYPGMRVLLTSSYHLSERQLERADCGVSGFIPKPYDLREVVEFVRSKVSGPPSSRRLWSAEPGSGVSPRPASTNPPRLRTVPESLAAGDDNDR
jgi:DNA-binding response OmpR family regulator